VPNGPVCREIQIVLETIKTKGGKAKVPSNWMMDSASDPFHSSIPRKIANDNTNQAIGAPSIPAVNPFGNSSFQAAAPPLSAIALLQQVEQARNLQGAFHQTSGPFVPINLVNSELRAQNNLIIASLASNINRPVLSVNPLQALLQACQNQVNPTIKALPLLLANQNQPPSYTATATPPLDTNQLLMALQSQVLANQANLNRTDASQVSTDSNSTAGNCAARVSSNGGNFRTLDEILQAILRSNGDLGNMLTLEEVNRMFKQK
jgi:hypothetical protein